MNNSITHNKKRVWMKIVLQLFQEKKHFIYLSQQYRMNEKNIQSNTETN